MIDPSLVEPEALRPLRRTEYARLVDLGCFDEERVELLYGMVVRMSAKGPVHDAVIQRLNEILVLALQGRAAVRIQSAFAATDASQPEPDVAVVPPGDYDDGHPSEAWLIVEVADTSLLRDRGKARLYAEAGVNEYWLVDIQHGLVEVHTDIVDAVYTRVTPYRPGDSIRPQRFPDVEVRVSQMLR
jgi:Uma2 family endonuclease